MSITPITPPTITPRGGPLLGPINRFSNFTPLTYEKGDALLEYVEAIRAYVNDNVGPHVDGVAADIVDAFNTQIDAVVTEVNSLLTGQAGDVNTALSSQATTVNTKLTQLQTAVDSAVQQVVNSTITITAPIIDARLPTAVLPTSGAIDVGVLIQAAYDAGLKSLDLSRGVTYLWNTPVFLDDANVYRPFVINGHGAIIKLGTSLPTTNWSLGNAVKFAVFPNTKRTALSAGKVTVNETNRATGSSGQIKGLIITDTTVTTDDLTAEYGFIFANRSTVKTSSCIALFLRVFHTWDSYTDQNAHDNGYLRGRAGTVAYFVDSASQGDGISIISPKMDNGTAWARLNSCRGAVISGAVTTPFEFIDCSGIVLIGAHLEGITNTAPRLTLSSSSVIVRDSEIYESLVDTVPTILINDTNSDAHSELVLENVQAVSIFTEYAVEKLFGPFISIITNNGNTRVKAKNLRGVVASTGFSGRWLSGRAPVIASTRAVISDMLKTHKARAAIASGDFDIHCNGNYTAAGWDIDTVAPKVYISSRQSAAARVEAAISLSGVPGGQLTKQAVYSYCIAPIDALGNYGQTSDALKASLTVAGDGVVRILGRLETVPTGFIIWRKAASIDVFNTPDCYVIFQSATPRIYLIDTGAFISGMPWITDSVPIPSVVAAANNTVSAMVVNGVAISS